jgi:hypothetical protein
MWEKVVESGEDLLLFRGLGPIKRLADPSRGANGRKGSFDGVVSRCFGVTTQPA